MQRPTGVVCAGGRRRALCLHCGPLLGGHIQHPQVLEALLGVEAASDQQAAAVEGHGGVAGAGRGLRARRCRAG